MTRKAKNIKLRVAAGALALGGLFAALAQVVAQPAPAAGNRLALVIGESAYRSGPVASAANDAGLIAQTLQVAGFDVTGAADLDQDGLRKTLREFVEKAGAAGPDATVFIYLSGRAVQYEGENYFAPIEAAVPAAANVPLETVRLSDYLTPLAQMPLKARIVVLDAARANTFAPGQSLAGGLALVDPPPGELVAFNAAPGTVAPTESGPYGVYAQALNEMMRRGGVPVDQVFDSVRLRVAEQTKGAQIPWNESKLSPAPVLLGRVENAPLPLAAPDLRSRPVRDYAVDQAYAAALERDTIAGYAEFLDAYPKSPYSARVRAILAVRREALTWRRARTGDTAEAYWTYLRRFPRGPHAEDARRRLAVLRAELAPPPRFAEYEFDVPPPPDWEAQEDTIYFRRPYVVFDDPDYGPPPPSVEGLPPRAFYDEPPPPPPHRNLLPLPLVAAPLLFAIPAIRHGLFHAPAPIKAQNPAAQQYYDERARPAPPAGGPAPFPPGGPRPGLPPQGATPQPGAPTGLPPQQPGAPGAQQPGRPLPPADGAPASQQSPSGSPRPGLSPQGVSPQGATPQPGAPAGLPPQQPGAPGAQQPSRPLPPARPGAQQPTPQAPAQPRPAQGGPDRQAPQQGGTAGDVLPAPSAAPGAPQPAPQATPQNPAGQQQGGHKRRSPQQGGPSGPATNQPAVQGAPQASPQPAQPRAPTQRQIQPATPVQPGAPARVRPAPSEGAPIERPRQRPPPPPAPRVAPPALERPAPPPVRVAPPPRREPPPAAAPRPAPPPAAAPRPAPPPAVHAPPPAPRPAPAAQPRPKLPGDHPPQ